MTLEFDEKAAIQLAEGFEATPKYQGPAVMLRVTFGTNPESRVCDVRVQYEKRHTWDVTRFAVDQLVKQGYIPDSDVFVWEYTPDGQLDESFARRVYENSQRVYKWREDDTGTLTFC